MGPNPKPLPSHPSPGHQTVELLPLSSQTYPPHRHLHLPWTPDMRPTSSHSSLLLTSCGYHWRPVQTCSLEELPHQYWHLVVATETHTLGKRAVPSYWNAFFLTSFFFEIFIFYAENSMYSHSRNKTWTVIVLKITIAGRCVGSGKCIFVQKIKVGM